MSLKEKIKNLFKKKIITINDRSSVNAIYTASNKDLKKVTDQVNHIQDTLDNLNIPVLPDHSDFATKSQDNTFTASNTFTKAVKLETFPEISKGNYEPTANKQLTPKFYVDKKVNEGVAGLDNKVNTLHNQQETKITSNTTKINANETKITTNTNKITQLENNTAKLDAYNRFQQPQEVAREVVVYGDHNTAAAHITFKNISTNERLGYIGKATRDSKDLTLKCETGSLLCDNAVTQPKSVATKEYVDASGGNTTYYIINRVNGRVDTYQTGNIYFHVVAREIPLTIRLSNTFKKNKRYMVEVSASLPNINEVGDYFTLAYCNNPFIYDTTTAISAVIPQGLSWTHAWKGNMVVGQNTNVVIRIYIKLTPIEDA